MPKISPAEMMCAREPNANTSTAVKPAGSLLLTAGLAASVIAYEDEPP
jgi:hypothetical protein